MNMDTIIETKNLTKKFGNFTANDHIDLTVKEGEIRAIIGENGAEQVVELPLTESEQASFHACCEGIRRNMEHLKEI